MPVVFCSGASSGPRTPARHLRTATSAGVTPDRTTAKVKRRASSSVVAAEHLLHFREEALGLRAGLAGLLEFLEQVFLLGGQVGRRLDIDLDVHVAALGRTDDRHALAARAELVAVLRARGDVDARRLAV